MDCNTINIKRLSRVGSGATGHVWQATTSDIEGAKVIALKQSRASLQLKRPLIEYEACILRYLQGHPSIPEFYAYGRQEHFEFLALELLGPSLGDLREGQNCFSVGTVLKIADQMLSSLSYIHKLGIVHRDIKPHNILLSLDNPDQLKIVDFGLARRIDSSESRTNSGNGWYVGTLGWASLNSHEGFQLTRRDDVESLAYILLALLRGTLPWQPYEPRHVFNATRQVLEKKRNWTGSRLGVGLAPPFGQFLDYARSLLFDEIPDYEGWIVTFKDLEKINGYDDHRSFDWTVQERPLPFPLNSPTKPLTPPPDFPVEKGQLIYVQILPRPTLEGFRPIFNDPSYWHDPELSNAPSLSMETIPGIVVETFVHFNGTLGIYVLPIQRGAPLDFMENRITRIVGNCLSKPDEDSIVLLDWPFDDTYCFAWPYPAKFAIPPHAKQLPSHWKVSTDIAKKLYEKYDTLVRHKVRSKLGLERLNHLPGGHQVFVQIFPLNPGTLQTSGGMEANWTAKKGWYNDLVKISKKIGKNQGYLWDSDSDSSGNELTDSYSASTGWENRQGRERDCSLTFGESFTGLKSEIFKFQLVVERCLSFDL